ncbi:hypothetical protein QQ008_18030 [Fulvivirgaceae bacterium BMA10]|uniref:LAGLIDADG homing endonuclease n=1 Tax=Splendidivirga corallicola TaxID=3051826 RepID=A0ABT8KSA1_9BACT|nr:hypothetical protein [Fulvivirgaceae bacterium BMA10]
MEVRDASIKILPYNDNDRGKFWEICIDFLSVGFSDKPVAYFQITAKDGTTQQYTIDFVHLNQRCKKFNILTYFTHRHTPPKEYNWLKELDARKIEYVIIKVKKNYKDNNYIFAKKLMSEDLI